jgi:hypothetical protein
MSSKSNDKTCYIILLLGVDGFQISSKYMNCNQNKRLKNFIAKDYVFA